ncbi:MAG: hypothetical protein K2L80_06400, partial [Muribaculaceae bacterium]|nr:hypothetical protein [Muribaculaceae bacterium]
VECTPGGKIIVGTNNDGIFVLDHTGQLTEHLRYDMNNPASLPSDHIASLLVHNGYLFAGTTKKGITIACLHPLEVKRVNTGIDADICFFSPLNDGRLAIGFDGGGLCVYDSIGSPVPSRHFTTANSSLPSDMVLGVARNDGRTYFSSYGGGIFSLDGKDFVVADNSDSLKFCRHIICLPDGSTLAATFGNGLIHIGRRTYNFNNSPLRTNSITCLHRAGDHVLVGTSTGLYLFDSNTKTITPSADSELASLLVLDIHVDSHGFTWLGTSEGVLVLNHQMRIIRRITRHDHLSNNFVKAIASDLNDGIWVTTVDGINHIRVTVAREDSIDFVCTPYMARDGIGEIDFDRHSIACAPDGRILAGGQGRYVIIDPASARTKKNKSKIKFTGLSVDGVRAEPGRPVASGRIVIDSPIISSPEITIDYFNGLA